MEDARSLIRTAFGDVARPSGATEITSHRCNECDELANDLSPYRWSDVPDKLLVQHASGLPLLTPIALVYYLPAWMLHALDNPSSIVTTFVLLHLMPSYNWSDENPVYSLDRDSQFHALSGLQCRAIAGFLSAMRGTDFEDEEQLDLAAKLWLEFG